MVFPALLLAAALLASPEAPDAPAAAPTPTPTPSTASGTFEDARFKLTIAGAYAFWDKAWMDDGRAIRVAVSNDAFPPEALDEHYDRGHAINTLFADDETKVVYFELDETGGYHGLSYYFESGDGCGYCFDSKVKSTVRAVSGGRLKGELSYAGDDRKFRIALDLPIPPKSWGDPLPKDGGEPGKAFLAYHAALERRDHEAILALSDAAMKKRFHEYETQGKLDGYLDYRWHDEHTDLKTIAITGGFIRGDHAVVLFDATNAYIDHLYGEAILRRENGAWLFHRDMVDVGTRE